VPFIKGLCLKFLNLEEDMEKGMEKGIYGSSTIRSILGECFAEMGFPPSQEASTEDGKQSKEIQS